MNIDIETTTNNNELNLIARDDKQILGSAKLLGVKSGKGNAVIIKYFMCENNYAATRLIKEGLMLSWELGYAAAFASNYVSLLKTLGFKRVDPSITYINAENKPLWGYELNWNGFENFMPNKK